MEDDNNGKRSAIAYIRAAKTLLSDENLAFFGSVGWRCCGPCEQGRGNAYALAPGPRSLSQKKTVTYSVSERPGDQRRRAEREAVAPKRELRGLPYKRRTCALHERAFPAMNGAQGTEVLYWVASATLLGREQERPYETTEYPVDS